VAITCRHGSIPEDVHQHIAERAEKLLNYFQRVTAINVTVIFEDDRVSTEIFVDAEHKHDFIARETGDEARGTFDRALQKMEQQIRKYKQKLQDHRRDRPVSELTGLPIEGGDEGTVEESSEP
jgi:putative sigma-54 modulation protein